MIRVSTRYAPHVLVLLGLVAIPTWLHHAGRFEVDDCADPGALLRQVDGSWPDAVVADRYTRIWGEGNWSHGSARLPSGAGRLEYVIVRSFDPKALYHVPESSVMSQRADERRLEMLRDGDSTLPAQYLVARPTNPSDRRASLAAYLLVYNGKAVSNPYWEQLVTAPLQFVTGRRPMWLFFVSARVRPKHQAEAEEALSDWLLASWERYRLQCLQP
jgi:hypothetical protein